MKSDLTDVPFDHYQRYAAAASLVRALGARAGTVLEVGANRQRLLGDFLPDHRLLYTDLEPQENTNDFVVADACALPFAEQSYDAVVSLDVLEHIPFGSRARAVAEMTRVAARLVVIGCPLDRPWVHEAEQDAHAVWRRYFDSAYPWLEEHEEYGLVDASQVEATLRSAGLQVIRFGQGDVGLWATLMGAHFVKEAVPELAAVVAAADRYYNRSLFEGDRSESAYREFFIGMRHDEDVDAVRGAAVLVGQGDAAGAELLSALGKGLLPVADRVRAAEQQWRKTAELLADTEARLQSEALAHHETGLQLQEMTANAVEQLQAAEQQWRKTAELLADTEARLQSEALAHHETGLQLQEMAANAVEQLRRGDAADRKVVALSTELAQTRGRLQASEQQRAGLAVRLDQSMADGRALSERLEQSQARCVTAEEQVAALRVDLDRLVLHRDGLIAHVDVLIDERDMLNVHVGRLSLRARGLERRQRWAIVATVVAALMALAGYLAWR